MLYDHIGKGYARLRQPDPAIAQAMRAALGTCQSVLNVGAGTGSYEFKDKRFFAVEPATTMIRQRAPDAAPAVQASASALPFGDNSFDATLAILTVHHWPDKARGLRELRRVSRDRLVIFTWDPAFPGFWLTRYFPAIMDIDRPIFPSMSDFETALGPVEVSTVPIPHDCRDGFMCAYWRRPEAYLDPGVRAAISTFSKLGELRPALKTLAGDLESGAWYRRNAELVDRAELDLGYRLVVAQA